MTTWTPQQRSAALDFAQRVDRRGDERLPSLIGLQPHEVQAAQMRGLLSACSPDLAICPACHGYGWAALGALCVPCFGTGAVPDRTGPVETP